MIVREDEREARGSRLEKVGYFREECRKRSGERIGHLHGSIGLKVERRGQDQDRLSRVKMIFTWRKARLEEDQVIGIFFHCSKFVGGLGEPEFVPGGVNH